MYTMCDPPSYASLTGIDWKRRNESVEAIGTGRHLEKLGSVDEVTGIDWRGERMSGIDSGSEGTRGDWNRLGE